MKDENEIWTTVEEYPNYKVTDDGIVKNFKTSRLIKACDNNRGYRTVNLYNNGHRKSIGVHRLVAELYVDGKEDGLEVNHKDGNKHNNYKDNLEWVTPSENELHAHRIGLKHGPNRKPVRIVETGEVFESINECARSIGGHDTSIGKCLRGQSKSHLGLTFEYADPQSINTKKGCECVSANYVNKKPYRRPIRVIETGEVFETARECARSIGGDQPTITACLKGRHKSHHGLHFEYVDD